MSDTHGFRRTRHVLTELLVANGSATALGLYLCIRHGDFKSVVDHKINPLDFNDSDDFRDCYFAVSLASKLAGLPAYSPEERSARALEGYLEVENELAQVTRPKLRRLFFSNPSCEEERETQQVIRLARDKIASVLGPFCLDELFSSCRFGPGASSSIRGARVCVAEKISSTSIECTRSSSTLLSAFVNATRWIENVVSLDLKEYSEVITVPKSSRTDRTIGIEPDGNIFLQLGIGAMIRRRLFRVGIDLDFGQDTNSYLAKVGSRDGSLATIDLSSASDRIHRSLVWELLPDDWWNFLSLTRTPYAKIGEFPFLLEKFSSMGNGFTFELQSLIFWALSSAVTTLSGISARDVKVFGDDIIIPTPAYPLLSRVFGSLGFQINSKKSYSTGYFRESCGSHFFKGVDVKPIFLKELLSNDLEIFKIANALRRYCHRTFGCDVMSTRYSGVYRALRAFVRKAPLIPDGIGDGGFVEYFDALPPYYRVKPAGNGYEGFYVTVFRQKQRTLHFPEPPAFMAILYLLWKREDIQIAEEQSSSLAHKLCGLEFPVRKPGPVTKTSVLVPVWTNPGGTF